MKLNAKAWLSLFVLVVAMGLLLFPPAGTFRYWQAWLYLSVFACASSITTLYLMRRDPALLARRMSGGPTAEKRTTQKLIMLFVSVCFVALLVVPALDRRFGWSHVPPVVVFLGDLLKSFRRRPRRVFCAALELESRLPCKLSTGRFAC